MEAVFRDRDQWQSAMMTLPDDTFFDLLRSAFGHIKTPFNKQNLLMDLWAFLCREDIQRNIAAYLDEADALVIAAVAVLRNPEAGDLERFFAGEGPELSTLLPNLEERFILYRYREGPALRLGLNPALAPVLGPAAEDPSCIFPSFPFLPAGSGSSGGSGGKAVDSYSGAFPFDDRTLGALLSFTAEHDVLGAGGRSRKKALDAGRRIFPGMDLETVFRCLLCLGLCHLEGESPVFEEHRLRAFGNLDSGSRRIYWGAGLILGAEPEIPAPQLFRGRIRLLARLIDRFLGVLEQDRLYPVKTLRRFLFILEREEDSPDSSLSVLAPHGLAAPAAPAVSGDSGTSGASGTPGPAAGSGDSGAETFWTALVQAGLLRCFPQGYSLGGPPSSGEHSEKAPVLVIDAPLFCLAYPGIGFADVLTLASFTAVRETGAIFRFELTRESCLRGFEGGLGAVDMEGLLVRLSGNPLEASLAWTLRDWEQRSGEVSLFEGALLTLSPERRYLAETGALAALIRRELAPGFYFLASGQGVAEALRQAGVDIFTRFSGNRGLRALVSGDKSGDKPGDKSGDKNPAGPQGGASTPLAVHFREEGSHAAFPPLGKRHPGYQDTGGSAMIGNRALGDVLPGQGGPVLSGAGGAAEALKARFREVLTGRTLSPPERNELAARIERRQVLAESQLNPGSVRAEKLEARGLDYVGKASIARQAISSHSLLEVVWSSPEGGEQRVLNFPLALEKSGGESILVIEDVPPRRVPGAAHTPGNPIRIPLGKISFLRRVKKSIFEV
jgi:hypothetical protein